MSLPVMGNQQKKSAPKELHSRACCLVGGPSPSLQEIAQCRHCFGLHLGQSCALQVASYASPDAAMSGVQPVPLSTSDKRRKAELAALAGLNLRAEALDVILELLAAGTPPNSLATVLNAICKAPAAAGTRRQASAAPAAAGEA